MSLRCSLRRIAQGEVCAARDLRAALKFFPAHGLFAAALRLDDADRPAPARDRQGVVQHNSGRTGAFDAFDAKKLYPLGAASKIDLRPRSWRWR